MILTNKLRNQNRYNHSKTTSPLINHSVNHPMIGIQHRGELSKL